MPYLGALSVCSRRGTLQINVYLYLTFPMSLQWGMSMSIVYFNVPLYTLEVISETAKVSASTATLHCRSPEASVQCQFYPSSSAIM